jgi:hypothetical protein
VDLRVGGMINASDLRTAGRLHLFDTNGTRHISTVLGKRFHKLGIGINSALSMQN